MKSNVVKITPAEAKKMLIKHGNQDQRNTDFKKVKKFSEEMKNNMFIPNGESIIISTKGRILDGKHRIHAIILSGITLTEQILVTEVLEELDDVDTFSTIDSTSRTPADILYSKGFKINSSRMATLLRIVETFEVKELLRKPSGIVIDNYDYVPLAEEYTQDIAESVCSEARSYLGKQPTISIVYWLLMVHISRTLPKMKDFVRELASASTDSDNGPVNKLLNYFVDINVGGCGGGAKISRKKWVAIFKAFDLYQCERDGLLRITDHTAIRYPKNYELYTSI